jgi:hypothetical protein
VCEYHFILNSFQYTKELGDINGAGGESIYGATFADEDLAEPLSEAGCAFMRVKTEQPTDCFFFWRSLLCMANKGADTNASQVRTFQSKANYPC